jgi:hypothetical protein
LTRSSTSSILRADRVGDEERQVPEPFPESFSRPLLADRVETIDQPTDTPPRV